MKIAGVVCYHLGVKLTSIYIDAANVILCAKRINFNLDLGKLFKYLYDKHKDCKIIFFVGDVLYLENIKYTLNEYRVELVIKQISMEGGRIKANCDVELTNRMTLDVERSLVDKIVIISGDGNFVFLMDYARDMGKLVLCIAVTPSSTSIFIKQRSYLRLMYLIQIKRHLEK
ncbi:MAG: NYN domain-containing protein [bacterium]